MTDRLTEIRARRASDRANPFPDGYPTDQESDDIDYIPAESRRLPTGTASAVAVLAFLDPTDPLHTPQSEAALEGEQ